MTCPRIREDDAQPAVASHRIRGHPKRERDEQTAVASLSLTLLHKQFIRAALEISVGVPVGISLHRTILQSVARTEILVIQRDVVSLRHLQHLVAHKDVVGPCRVCHAMVVQVAP